MDMDDPLDEDFEQVLQSAAPKTTTVSNRVEDELARMTVAARTDDALARRADRWNRPGVATGAIVGALLLTGAGVAAASAGTNWIFPWAETPAVEFSYTLPSGKTCESRIGGLSLSPEFESQETDILKYLAGLDVMDAIDIDEEIAAARSNRDVWMETDEGIDVPAWYGTEYYPSPDREYSMAVQKALREVIFDELERRGLDPRGGQGLLGLEAETKCPGAEG
ncbi:hypothetical protein [Microbacterium sp. zg-YB36]|uniref:hypothetical protein n=1 Tax=Microbacterium sp. zg-YB36 TaxID=2969407 RepID=UPI00214A940C|nr:hypothetical protein [Microbacterium sp. zg-YB36]MDL5351061.1 hypothetical protein [Microbacterium sp. zg-YB36]